MPQIISTEPGAWILRIPRPQISPTRIPRRVLSFWWNGWRTVASELSREETR